MSPSALTCSAIGGFVEPVQSIDPAMLNGESFTYVDLSAVDNELKSISGQRVIATADAPSRARQLIHAGDVLVSTVRPNLNALAIVPQELDGAIASTGFCVLRAQQGKLHPSYLFHWMRTSTFVRRMVQLATGQSYPAVSDRIIKDSIFPLPSIAEQRRIAAILDQAEALRTKRRRALAKLETLNRSLFLEMFGNPWLNPRGWQIKKFGEVGVLDRGVSKHRPRNAPELLGGAHPLIQTGEITNCDGYVRTYQQAYSDAGLKQSKMWPAGTLCITIAANIAKTGILKFAACFPDSVVGFEPDELATVEYVQVWMSFMQKHLEENAPSFAQKNINLAILRALPIPVPPKELQQDFSHRLARLDELKQSLTSAEKKSDNLFASLQQRAFRGEL